METVLSQPMLSLTAAYSPSTFLSVKSGTASPYLDLIPIFSSTPKELIRLLKPHSSVTETQLSQRPPISTGQNCDGQNMGPEARLPVGIPTVPLPVSLDDLSNPSPQL